MPPSLSKTPPTCTGARHILQVCKSCLRQCARIRHKTCEDKLLTFYCSFSLPDASQTPSRLPLLLQDPTRALPHLDCSSTTRPDLQDTYQTPTRPPPFFLDLAEHLADLCCSSTTTPRRLPDPISGPRGFFKPTLQGDPAGPPPRGTPLLKTNIF